MSFEKVITVLHDLRQKLRHSRDGEFLQQNILEFVAQKFDASLVTISVKGKSALAPKLYHKSPELAALVKSPIVKLDEGNATIGGASVQLPLFISDCEKSRASSELVEELKKYKVLSYAVIGVYENESLCGLIEVAHCGRYFKWRNEDMFLFEQIASFGGLALEYAAGNQTTTEVVPRDIQENEDQGVEQKQEIGDAYQRLARYGNLLFIKTNANFQIEEILGDTRAVIGIEQKDLLKDNSIWQRFLHFDDLKRLRRMVARMRFMQQELREEVRVRANSASAEERVLLIRGIPIFNVDGDLSGWEGLAVDITEKRRAEDEIVNQNKRIEALYEVARTTQLYHEPAHVMLKGLSALIRATNSDAGLGCFYNPADDRLEVATVEGLSAEFVEEIQKRISTSTLIRQVISSKLGIVVKNIQEDPRALVDIVRREGVKSSIIVPLMLDSVVYGILVLYCKDADRYQNSDFDLVTAAASQICIASRQAEHYAAEKQNADSVAALYRISHELSKYVSTKEVAERAFPLIQKEFPCKRMWLGVINEQATHIVGQAGAGPGVREKLIGIQIELYLRHDFLDEALKTKQPVIVRAGQNMECSGLNSIMRRLKAGTFVILPLVALGQVVGVLIVEPSYPSVFLAEKKLGLLARMTSEIATVLLARRFETKMAEADKMRMAGMLASGVAHNFNNLLQAVMGQASLMEMQLPPGSPLVSSARMIIEAAGKGAGLITQLLSFSAPDAHKRRSTSVEDLIRDSAELYSSIVGSQSGLEFDVQPDLSEIFVDYAQLQQVMSNLLINAKEAVTGRSNPRIAISASEVTLKSGEIDPELAPGTYVRIDVEDNGVGMDSEQQARCFEPFYTTKNTDTRSGLGFSGSGLGLSSVYSIMKQHEGLIAVRSKQSEGTVFSLYFPVAATLSPSVQDLATSTAAKRGSVDVIMYDLDEPLYNVIRPIFDSLDLLSSVVTSEDQALKLVRSPITAAKTVMIDVDRVGYDVIGCLRQVHSEFPQTLIVILANEPRRWSRLLSAFPNLHIVSKPLGVWGVHALARRILQFRNASSLKGQIAVDEEGSSINGATLSQEQDTAAVVSEKDLH